MKKKYKPFYSIFQWVIICVVSLTSLPAYADNTADYIHNASGGLRIGLVHDKKTIILVDEPKLLKVALDLGWNRVRAEWDARIINLINEMSDPSGIEVASDLATIDRTELKVMKIDKGLSLKYVLHDNKMRMTVKPPWPFPELSYVANFEIEIVLAIRASSHVQQLQITDTAISIRDIKIDGGGVPSDIVKALLEQLINSLAGDAQEPATQVNTTLLPLMQEINNQLTSVTTVLSQIPSEAIYLDSDVDPINGTISLCFKSDPKEHCVFPTSNVRPS